MAKTAFGAKRGQSTLQFDPNDLIVLDDQNHPLYDPREKLDLDEAMVRNIMAIGVINPITIAKDGEGRPMVVAGRRRVMHAREANRRLVEAGSEPRTIPAIPRRESGNNTLLFAVSISENEHRLDDTPIGRARKAARLLDMGASEDDAATIFGVTAQTIRNWMALLDTSAPVQKAVEKGEISASTAVTLGKLETAAEQTAALEELKKAAPPKPKADAKPRKQRTKRAKKTDPPKEPKAKKPSARQAEAVVAKAKGEQQTTKGGRMKTRRQIEQAIKDTPHMHPAYLEALCWVLGVEPEFFGRQGMAESRDV